jgi:hypothetical protein
MELEKETKDVPGQIDSLENEFHVNSSAFEVIERDFQDVIFKKYLLSVNFHRSKYIHF